MATLQEIYDLNPVNVQILNQGTLFARQAAGKFARFINEVEPLLKGAGAKYIKDLISALDDGTLIPLYDPSSEFAGATYMSKERFLQLTQLYTDLVALNTAGDTGIEAACVEAVGPFKVRG